MPTVSLKQLPKQMVSIINSYNENKTMGTVNISRDAVNPKEVWERGWQTRGS